MFQVTNYGVYLMKTLFFTIILFVLSCENRAGREEPEHINPLDALDKSDREIIENLNQFSKRINSKPLENTDTDLTFLDQYSESKIIGLGEATHGTREFFQMKHRIFKYMVEKHGFKVFGFEADFGESLYINDYVTQGIGNLDEIMKTKMHFWTWRTEEVKELIEWMRQYNIGKNENDKIHFLGVDCQFTTYQPSYIQKVLEVNNSELFNKYFDHLNYFKKIKPDDYSKLSDNQLNTNIKYLTDLLVDIELVKDQFTQALGHFKYRLLLQMIENLKQTYYHSYYAFGNKNYRYRDQYMASNSLWLLDLFGEKTKAVLWAHNAHIERNPYYVIGGSQGFHLSKSLGHNYNVIAFSFALGNFTASEPGIYKLNNFSIGVRPLKRSINYYLSYMKEKNFVLDLREIDESQLLKNIFSVTNKFLSIGAVFNNNPNNYYRNIQAASNWDLLIHFNVTNYSKQLK
jgi:erythromycin esterase